MRVNHRDLAAGALFVAIGLFFGLNAWLNLKVGVAFQMGPGYFPILLGGVLCCFGLAICLTALGRAPDRLGPVSWRGIALVTAGILFFSFTVRGLGLGPALAGGTFLAALSTGRVSVKGSAALGVGLAVFAVLVFKVALGLQYKVFGPWLTG